MDAMSKRDLFAELSAALEEAKAHLETTSIKTPPVTETPKLDVSIKDQGETTGEGTPSVRETSGQYS